ncbi:MAG: histidine kinase [Marinoscillum sp.]
MSASSSGQDSLLFKRITEEDGLAGNSVKCMMVDSRGFLWIGTNVGLNRYDGYDFKIYQFDPEDATTISGNSINSILEDRNGNIWIGTESAGLNRFDPKTDKFKRFSYSKDDPNSISGDRVQCIAEDLSGDIWVGLDDGAGLCKLNASTGKFTRYDPFKDYPFEKYGQYFKAIRDMSFRPNNPNELWMATILGLMSFDLETQTFKLYAHTTYEPGGRPVGTWCIDWQDEQNLRIGFFGIGSDVFNVVDKQWENHHWTLSYDFRVLDLWRKSESQYWVAARKKGLGILDIPTNTYHFPNAQLEIERTPFPGMTNCLTGSASDIWAGGKYGISYFNGAPKVFDFNPLPFTSEEFGRVATAVYWDDDLWVGGISGAGLMQMRGNQLTTHLPKGYKEMTINEMVRFSDRLLIVEDYSKLWWFSKKSHQFTPIEFAKDVSKEVFVRLIINACIPGKDSILYLGTTYTGFTKLDLATGEFSTYMDEKGNPLSSISNNDMILIDGNVWIATQEGLVVFSPENETFERKNLKSLAGMRNQRVHAVRQHPDGSIWVASVIGLIVIKNGEERMLNISNSRLASNFTVEVKFDMLGNAWVGTDKGISMITPDSYEIRNFDRMDGVDYSGRITPLPTGHVIIGSYGGYTQVNPIDLIVKEDLRDVQVTEFKVFDKEYPLDQNINFTDDLTLSYQDQFFSFSFSKPEFAAPHKVSYAYQLTGFDTGWVMSGTRRYASYTNLSGGNYQFKVKAQGVDGAWTPVKSINLTIKPPFWKTSWFLTVVLLVLISLIYSIYKWRMNYLLREERIKSEFEKKIAEIEMTALRAQMNPHFLFNSLNSINSYIIKNKVHEATAYLTKFSRLIRLILQNSQTHLISLHDEISALRLYVELEAFRFEGKFTYAFIVDEDLEISHIEMPPMIIQPYVENAIWHGLMHKGTPGKLTLSFRRLKGFLEITIDDDGVGREEASRLKSKSATKRKSLGMKITRDRLEVTRRLFGREMNVNIIDKKNDLGVSEGTRVVIKLPLE